VSGGWDGEIEEARGYESINGSVNVSELKKRIEREREREKRGAKVVYENR